MKRNDIVICVDDEYWSPYGRIVRKLDNNQFEVIDCDQNVRVINKDKLELHNEYKGMWVNVGKHEVWFPMLTLRKLKQKCRYNKII